MKNSKQRHYEQIAAAIAYLHANHQQQPDLKDVAAHVNLSPYHFQRLFSEWAGVSPKKFLQYLTVSHAKSLLSSTTTPSVLAVSHEVGLSGSSRLHDLFVNIEGMTPAMYKQQGKDLHIRYNYVDSPFGTMLVAATDKGICCLAFEDEAGSAFTCLKTRYADAQMSQESDALHQQALRFFDAPPSADNPLKLHLKGTPFQLKVWEALLKIPAGQVSTYGRLAHSVGNAKAARAVGSAVGSNPVAFLIPCHRVIRQSGVLGDYHWGQTRKAAMVGWESARLVS